MFFAGITTDRLTNTHRPTMHRGGGRVKSGGRVWLHADGVHSRATNILVLYRSQVRTNSGLQPGKRLADQGPGHGKAADW